MQTPEVSRASHPPLDTLAIAQMLREGGIGIEESEVHAEVFGRVIESNLATKYDIVLIQRDIADVRRDMEEMRVELKHDIEELRTELKHDIAELRLDNEKQIEIIRKEIAQSQAGVLKAIIGWIVGAVIVQSSLMAALKLFG